MKCLVLFVSGALAFGAAALGLGYLAVQDDAAIQGGTAFALTFFPAVLTLAWVTWSYRSVPEMQLLATLGGSGLRMAIALGGGLFLTRAKPLYFDNTLWEWLLLFYLSLLAYEITLIVWQQPKLDRSPQA
jgi:hypothetical protein